MLTVHYLVNSRAHRLLWLLEELGVAYDIKVYQRDANFRAPRELREVHPLGKSPVITDGDVTLAESAAIFEYVLGRHDGEGRLAPAATSPDWPRHLYFFHSVEGTVMPLLTNKFIFKMIPERAPWIVRPIARTIAEGLNNALVARQLPRLFDLWESALKEAEWFGGGAFSAADIMMSYAVEAAGQRADAFNGRPKLVAWLERVRQRPAYQAASTRGGGYGVL